jgi:hypothetical protein
MSRIAKPNPPEHIVLVDTNILWHEDKSHVVNPDFDAFWDTYSPSFPMKLILPDVVRGELLFQQTTSALKLLEKANQDLSEVSRITAKQYSHRVNPERVKREIEERFSTWTQARQVEIKNVPIADIDWAQVIEDSIWRRLPFTPDAKNPKNEKGFRDYMILETACAVCKFYSSEVNIAFICGDFALRTAADQRLGAIESYTSYESIGGFQSFIELTKKNLTERFVKSILSRAAIKFHDEKDRECLVYKDGFISRLRSEFKQDIENPTLNDPFSFLSVGKREWKHIGREQAWVTRPQFRSLENEHEYHWTSKITYVRLYERESESLGSIIPKGERRLMVMTLDVHWKSKVRADGRFFDCEIVEYSKSGYSFDRPTDEQLERYGIEKMVEQGGPANPAPPGTSAAEQPRVPGSGGG